MPEKSIPLDRHHIHVAEHGNRTMLQVKRRPPYHHSLCENRMTCRQIIRVELTIRGTFMVEYQEARKKGLIVTKECSSLFGIRREKNGEVSFGYIAYVTEKKRRRWMKEFAHEVYDDVPLKNS